MVQYKFMYFTHIATNCGTTKHTIRVVAKMNLSEDGNVFTDSPFPLLVAPLYSRNSFKLTLYTISNRMMDLCSATQSFPDFVIFVQFQRILLLVESNTVMKFLQEHVQFKLSGGT